MTNAEPLPAAFRLSALSAAVAEFLRSAEQMAYASGNLTAAAYHLREAGDAAAAERLETSRSLLETALDAAAVPALRYGAELAELLERDGATAAEGERLRWKLADVWDGSGTGEPHPVPVSGVYAVPGGVVFLPHGDTFPGGEFRAEQNAEGTGYTVQAEPLGACYTMPPEVLAQLAEAAAEAGAVYSGPPSPSADWHTWRLPPEMFVSARRDPERGGVLLERPGGESPLHVPEGAGYVLPFPLGGLFRLTVYAAELTGDPDAPAEVRPLTSGAFLTHEAADALELLGVASPSREPLNTLTLNARRKAWDSLPAPNFPPHLN